jgi:hypothetical protein
MTPERQRIAIAEACGWEIKPPLVYAPDGRCVVTDVWTNGQVLSSIPDYLTDLNAMHEAEKVLRGTDFQQDNDVVFYKRWHEYQCYLIKRYGASATATQRAEAFLRTLGLWKDDV